MDVFTAVLSTGHRLFRASAIHAAHRLSLFDALPGSLATLSKHAGVAAHRLRPLLDVLVFEGVLAREGALFVVAERPPDLSVPDEGWGRLHDVLRTGRPLPAPEGELLARYHQHLAESGSLVAAEVMQRLRPAGVLADLGGGSGAWARAWLGAGGREALVVDCAEVVALAGCVRTLAADLRDDRWVSSVAELQPDVILLANVLHLLGEDDCRALVSRAARAVKPGGVVAVKDFFVESDRSGPAESIYFALNMVLHTEAGDVHAPSNIAGWLREAGLEDVTTERLDAHPDAMLVTARRR